MFNFSEIIFYLFSVGGLFTCNSMLGLKSNKPVYLSKEQNQNTS